MIFLLSRSMRKYIHTEQTLVNSFAYLFAQKWWSDAEQVVPQAMAAHRA